MRMDIDEDSPANCREVRRRRVEMRRLASLPGAASAPSGSSGEGGGESQKLGEQSGCEEEGQWNRNQTDGSHSSSSSFSSWATGSGAGEELPGSSSSSRSDQAPAADQSSIYGFMSVSGRSRVMEDAVSLRPDFYRPEVVGRQKLHFFGVFDGHGGSHVSTLCRERMHELLAEEVGRVSDSSGNLAGGYGWSVAMGRCFQRMDEVALSACACGRVGSCESCGVKSDIVGSTAVVAVVGPDRMVVANCGDSRAVLCRGGRAIPLSNDHKPDRPDELARIEAAGGRVIYLNGARVLGILAMSRALGDKYLKPIVISEPEVNVTERTPDDEFLILASDGLWDVLSNDTACEVAWTCLHEGGPPSIVAEILDTGGIESTNEDKETQASRSRCSVAAALLTRLALGRKSDDNISVIVVDLRRG